MLEELKDAIKSYQDEPAPKHKAELMPRQSTTTFRDESFLNSIDEEIKRTEDSIKVMNQRYVKMRSTSPMIKIKEEVPVYQATLYRK